MKISVCGASDGANNDEIRKKAFEIGKALAESNVLVLTGATYGYPHAAAKGAFSNNGKVMGISPAKDEKEHINKYKFPTDSHTQIEFTGLGIPGRNYPLVKEGGAVIIISGQIGTLNEFTMAFHANKPIGILKDSGGITDIIEKIAEICNKSDEKENIVYSDDPKELVQLVIDKLKNSAK
ncbi:LOG family protein [Candidatus Woesearchaeota archaeon]|nr:LOG family protein [Candidatus Woesearchaeota archaeon]